MWPFRRLSNDRLVLALDPKKISLALFAKTDEKIPYKLCLYKSVAFNLHEYANAILFNPTRLKSIVDDFVQGLCDVPRELIIGVTGPHITEKVVSLSRKEQAATVKDTELESIIWDCRLLYEQDYQRTVYYYSGISRELLFQFQLFALCNSYDLIAVTTPMIGYLELCRAKEGEHFSSERFGDHMMTCNDQINQLITIDDLAAMVRMDNTITFSSPDDIAQVGQLLGLMLVGEAL